MPNEGFGRFVVQGATDCAEGATACATSSLSELAQCETKEVFDDKRFKLGGPGGEIFSAEGVLRNLEINPCSGAVLPTLGTAPPSEEMSSESLLGPKNT